MTPNNRPATPNLDAVEHEAKALAAWKVEQEREMANAAERRAVEAARRPERERVARERRTACEQAARDAQTQVTVLADALARYVANAPRQPWDMKTLVGGFLLYHFGQYAPLQTYGISNHVPDLVADLYQGAK